MTDSNTRHADYPISPLFLDRWSPRAYDSSTMPEADLLTMLEAARYAPSAANGQPWRSIYALRDTPEWDKLFALLVPFNQGWAKTASALVFVISKTARLGDDGVLKPIYSHAFDAGSAWMSLALQASIMGYHAHGMGGVDYEGTRKAFELPENYRLEAAVAIGKQAARETLSAELAAREVPSQRLPLADIAFKGIFIAD
jgi:nitroreductase